MVDLAGKYSKLVKNAQNKANVEKIVFKFISGKYAGGEFFLKINGSIIIGRDISSDVAIIDTKVSRKHAYIWNSENKTWIQDNASTNGTTVNKQPLKAKEKKELFPGDIITIGESTIHFIGDPSMADKIKTPDTDEVDSIQTMQEIELIPESSDITQDTNGKDKGSPIELKQSSRSHEDQPEIENSDELELGAYHYDNPENNATENTSEKVSVGRVALKKQAPGISSSKTAHDSAIHTSKGEFNKIEPIDLLQLLSQSSSVGFLKCSVTKPFIEKVELAIGVQGVVYAKSLSNSDFSQEKVFTRFLLSKEGEYHFKISEEPRREQPNSNLEDIVFELSSNREMLTRYRKIISSNQLKINVPITGDLSALSKSELDTLQFMINAQEVVIYLSMFPEQDELMLIAEILKFIDLGILFGDNNEEIHSPPPDDLLDL